MEEIGPIRNLSELLAVGSKLNGLTADHIKKENDYLPKFVDNK